MHPHCTQPDRYPLQNRLTSLVTPLLLGPAVENLGFSRRGTIKAQGSYRRKGYVASDGAVIRVFASSTPSDGLSS